jgi:quinol-cytochrome oxidoreductase complex cytochrome b subunit
MKMKELTNLYVATKARLEKDRPVKKQKTVEGISLSDELMRDGAIIAFMVAVIFLLISIVPPPLHPGYDMTKPPRYVKPDWYLLWSLGPIFLAKWPVPNPLPFGPDILIDTKFLGTIFVNGAFVALILIPFIGKGKARRPIEAPMNAAMGVFGLASIFTLSVVAIADIIFAYEVQPLAGHLHWINESQKVPDPSELINWLGIWSLWLSLACTFLTYWFLQRHRPKYETKLNATYFKVR